MQRLFFQKDYIFLYITNLTYLHLVFLKIKKSLPAQRFYTIKHINLTETSHAMISMFSPVQPKYSACAHY